MSYITVEEDEGWTIDVSREGAKITVEWRIDVAEDIEEAEALFKELTEQGWLAVLVSTSGAGSQRVLEFKPEYGRLRFIPLSEGG